MPSSRIQVLHLEDSALDAELVQRHLARGKLDCDIVTVASEAAFREALTGARSFDIILADFSLPGFDGLRALDLVGEAGLDIPFIFVSGAFGEETAIEAMRHGAADYILKQRLERLPHAVSRAIAAATADAERKRAGAALRREQEMVRHLLSGNLIGVAIVEGERVRECNDAYLRLIGRARTDMEPSIEGGPVMPVPAPALPVNDDAGEGASSPETRYETELRRADGTRVPVMIGSSWIDPERRTRIFFVVDLTRQQLAEKALLRLNETLEQRVVERTQALEREIERRRAAEMQLYQSQKMEAIGQLTGGIAHDFNNLLNAIIGNLELAEMKTADEAILKHIRNAIRSADRSTRLTSHLLAFSRRQTLDVRPLDLGELITGMADMLGSTITPSIRHTQSLDPDLWWVNADPTQLELAILNLVINARDAMPEGGTLGILARNLPADAAGRPDDLGAGEFVVLSVTDTGTGMTGETLSRAVEPFYTTKGPGKGSGLGLSMVYGVAKQLGGTLRIESSLGQGTSISIYLGRAEPEAARDAPGSLAAEQEENGHILLVDDDPDMRETTAGILRRIGYTIAEAGSTQAALAILDRAARPIDLLVTDSAAGQSGDQLATEIRRSHPHLPVLIISGYGALELPESGDGRMAFLKKPFRAAALAAKIRDCLDEARVI